MAICCPLQLAWPHTTVRRTCVHVVIHKSTVMCHGATSINVFRLLYKCVGVSTRNNFALQRLLDWLTDWLTKGLMSVDICYDATYMRRTRDQQCFAISQRAKVLISLVHFTWVVNDTKCILVTRVCMRVCVSVPHRVPTILHGPGCNLGNGRDAL